MKPKKNERILKTCLKEILLKKKKSPGGTYSPVKRRNQGRTEKVQGEYPDLNRKRFGAGREKKDMGK